MKGGITSGVLYPLAVCELATTYRLRNVGWHLGRRDRRRGGRRGRAGRTSGAPGSGFDGLATLPDWLGSDGHLVGPVPALGAHRAAARSAAQGGRAGTASSRTAELVLAAVGYGLRTKRAWLGLLGAVPGRAHLLAALLGASDPWEQCPGLAGHRGRRTRHAVGLVVGAVLAAVKDAGDALSENLYGIVTGSQAVQGRESLCDWLTDKLDELAGRPLDGPPLTFGDLWGADADDPAIVLEMQTTNVTEGRPYRLPTRARLDLRLRRGDLPADLPPARGRPPRRGRRRAQGAAGWSRCPPRATCRSWSLPG